MPADGDRQLIEQLSHSALYRDYERAFGASTGLPLTGATPSQYRESLTGHEPAGSPAWRKAGVA